jgi:hypothetical protein
MDLGLGFLVFPLVFSKFPLSPLCVLCTLVFIGEVWLGHEHIGPLISLISVNFDFSIFLYFL